MYLLDLVEKAEVFPKGLVMLLIEMHEVALAREQQGSHLPDASAVSALSTQTSDTSSDR